MHEDWNELKILLSKIPTLTVYFFGAYERLINLLTGNVMLYMIWYIFYLKKKKTIKVEWKS